MPDKRPTIDADIYADVTGYSSHEDIISIDRQGFSPEIAEANGSGYMDEGTAYIFTVNQLHTDQEAGPSYLGDVLTYLSDETDLHRHLDGAAGLVIETNVVPSDYHTGQFIVDVVVSPGDERRQRQLDVAEQIDSLSETELKDGDYLRDLVEDRSGTRSMMLEDDDDLIRGHQVPIDGFTYTDHASGETTYHFNSDEWLYVTTDESDTVPDIAATEKNIDPTMIGIDDPSILDVLSDHGLIEIDDQQVLQDYQNRGKTILTEQGYDHDPGTMDFYRTLVSLDLPADLEALEDLYRDNDLTIDAEPDMVKLDYIEGNGLADELLSAIRESL